MDNRYNSFLLIHKGLRTAMYHTALQLQQCDFANVADAEAALEQLDEVLMLMESHAHGEDTFINIPLEQLRPEVARMFEKEHEEDHTLFEKLNELTASLRKAINPQERLQAGSKLLYAYYDYLAFNVSHMNKEEILLNQTLWETYTDEQIVAAEQNIIQSHTPEKMALYVKWMLRGNNDADLRHWLGGVKQFAPAPVFPALMGIAANELPQERFKKLETALA